MKKARVIISTRVVLARPANDRCRPRAQDGYMRLCRSSHCRPADRIIACLFRPGGVAARVVGLESQVQVTNVIRSCGGHAGALWMRGTRITEQVLRANAEI